MQLEIIKIDLNGPEGAGLTRMELSEADFLTPLPVQHVHEYFASPTEGLTVGVWATTDMQEKFGPYSMDEFIIVSEGEFDLVGEDGLVARCRAGQAALLQISILVIMTVGRDVAYLAASRFSRL